jgi:hypothetical protein
MSVYLMVVFLAKKCRHTHSAAAFRKHLSIGFLTKKKKIQQTQND